MNEGDHACAALADFVGFPTIIITTRPAQVKWKTGVLFGKAENNRGEGLLAGWRGDVA